MNRHVFSRLVRPLALLLLLAGVLVLGANNAAWATPAQAPSDQPTVPRREPPLVLKDIKCNQGLIEVEFNLERLRQPDIDDYGIVTYVVNGQTRFAAFEGR